MMTSQTPQNVIKEINKLIGKDVIEHTDHEKGDFLSPIFSCSKSDETSRLIMNLKTFKEFLENNHFKMETVHSIEDLFQPHCYMTSINLKDAYYLAKFYLKLKIYAGLFF